nr:MAG TPA: hypothetical protein [Inoviridae sp.]
MRCGSDCGQVIPLKTKKQPRYKRVDIVCSV